MPYARMKNELPLIPGYSEGAIAYAPDAATAPLNECICYINPVQSGSGDPSPSNVRPITGHTELNLVQKDGNGTVVHTYTTDFGTTVYGGTLDVVSGVLTIKMSTKKKFRDYYWGYNPTYRFFYCGISDIVSSGSGIVCDCYETVDSTIGLNDKQIKIREGGISLTDTSYTDTTSFLNAMGDNEFVYELATPTTTQLTPQEVTTLLGENSFYHDCNGDTKITFIRRLDS